MVWIAWLLACEADPAGPGTEGDSASPAIAAWPHACDPVSYAPSPIGGAPVPASDPHSEQAGADPIPYAVHLGLPSSDPSRSRSFVWRTDVDTLGTVVEYGRGENLDYRAEGSSFRYGDAATGTGPYRVHEVKLCDALEPGSSWRYRVGSEAGWSPIYTFTTAPAPGEAATVRIALAGDSRGSYETWGTVVALMESHDPDFYVFTGDMVELGVDQAEWDAWWAAAGDVFANKLLLPAHGNHEFLAQHWFAQMSLPGNEEWYGVRWGDLTLVTLNDTVRDVGVFAGAEAELLDAAFAAAPDDWKLVAHHASEYATCSTHGSNLTLRAAWAPIYDRHGVNLVLGGHNHTYERSVPIRADAEATLADGTTYLVSGGGGAPLYTGRLDEWFGNVHAPVEHYVIIDVGSDSMHVVARDLAGTVIDDFTIPRA